MQSLYQTKKVCLGLNSRNNHCDIEYHETSPVIVVGKECSAEYELQRKIFKKSHDECRLF